MLIIKNRFVSLNRLDRPKKNILLLSLVHIYTIFLRGNFSKILGAPKLELYLFYNRVLLNFGLPIFFLFYFMH